MVFCKTHLDQQCLQYIPRLLWNDLSLCDTIRRLKLLEIDLMLYYNHIMWCIKTTKCSRNFFSNSYSYEPSQASLNSRTKTEYLYFFLFTYEVGQVNHSHPDTSPAADWHHHLPSPVPPPEGFQNTASWIAVFQDSNKNDTQMGWGVCQKYCCCYFRGSKM